jgi:coenzyme F420-reducing hydrogenase alpha subunit
VSVEGALTVDLRVDAGRVASVDVRSTRRADVTRALAGTDVRWALAVLPALFSVCGAAHLAAGLAACEAALGVVAQDNQRTARRLVVALEALDNHAFQVCVTWPGLLGRGPCVEPLQRLRLCTDALRRWTFGGARWAEPGGVAVSAHGSPAPLVAELRAIVASLAPDEALTGDAQDLRRWARADGGPAGALLRAADETGAAGFGAVTTPLLPDLPAAWFEARLAEDGFGVRPTLDGRPAEAGFVARTVDHPAVAAYLARSGRTLGARLVARLADMRVLVDRVDGLAQELRPSSGLPCKTSAPGTGTGVAETSRGPLAHRVELASGRVARWRTVAPTEWTFHPDGAVREALLGAPAEDLTRRAEWLVAALDPCVACDVEVR